MKTVTRSFLRYLPRRRGLSFLQLMGIACGVAAVIGMTLSARAALSSFGKAVEFLSGKATHSMKRPAGPMEETLLTKLMKDPAVRSFSPVIDRRVRLGNGELVRILGIDPFLDGGIRPDIFRKSFNQDDIDSDQAFSFFLEEKTILMDEGLAAQIKVGPGNEIKTSKGVLRIIGEFPNPSGESLMMMDISHAQKLFGLEGLIDRIDLIISNEPDFRSRWEKGFLIQSSRQRKETLGAMMRAFRLNLEALSLLALFVGVFLIYNTAMFAVISRRKDAGILMSLGARRHEIIAAFSAEILLLGGLGGALGGVIGYFLNRFLTLLIGGTISNLYFFLRPEPFPWSLWIVVTGVFLGCAASIIGGAYPLIELVRTRPIQALSGRAPDRKGSRKAVLAALAGLIVLVISLALLIISRFHVYLGFAGAFGFLTGVSLLTGIVMVLLGPVLRKALDIIGGLPGKVAAGFIRRNLSRTAVAVAAFMVALTMSIGLGAMIGSFRQSLIWWMGSQLNAEIYIGNSPDVVIPEDFYEEVRSTPGVGGVDVFRNVQIIYQGVPVYLAAIDASVLKKYTSFGWLEGGDENWDPVKNGSVVVSESFFRRFGVGKGGLITLDGNRGPIEFQVSGVFYDYTTEHGLIMMNRPLYLDIFGDHTIGTIGVFMDEGTLDRRDIIEKIKRKALALGLPVKSRQEFHDGIMSVFDSTFAVTRSMRVMAIIIALFGIAGALLTLFMERQREFGIYRALGFSTRQVAGMTLMEGLGLGLVSFLLSVGTGTLLALILIKVINLRSFNWTVFFHADWRPYLLAGVTAAAASLAASAYPIWKIYRTYPQMQIRED